MSQKDERLDLREASLIHRKEEVKGVLVLCRCILRKIEITSASAQRKFHSCPLCSSCNPW
jgi:hypothetical protein